MKQSYESPMMLIHHWGNEVLTDIVSTSGGGGDTPWEGQGDFFGFSQGGIE